jgi:hypothetical protein
MAENTTAGLSKMLWEMALSDISILTRGRVAQIACVTTDLNKTANKWSRLTGAGPFYCGKFLNDGNIYRGEQFGFELDIAFGYLGDMQIQIAAPLDDSPSIYQEIIDRNGGGVGFHHTLILTDDVEADKRRFQDMGIAIASEFRSSKMHVVFFDTVEELGFFVEYFQMSPYFEDFFTRAHKDHLAWDGVDPVRRHPLT